MKDATVLSDTFDYMYQEIDTLIKQKKIDVKRVVNDAMVSLYWGIGKSSDNCNIKRVVRWRNGNDTFL